ncbi:Mg chelatase-like protein [compost metagenome]
MVARVSTVAFQGIEGLPVDVQVMVAPGKVGMQIVGLPDKAVAESRERVQAALHASGLALPAKRVTVNLAPADLPKEGSHFDLAIALGLMAALGAIPGDALSPYVVIGELNLDGTIAAVAGALPAAIGANALGKGLICPAESGAEAAWAGAEIDILAPRSLIAIANHFRGTQVLSRPQAAIRSGAANLPDLADIKGQESAKRALEVAAAGNHNLLMVGPPGSGKSMLAARLPSILPPLNPAELLEVSMIHSIAGQLPGGKLSDRRPFRTPHHSATMAAMVGGGLRARPGEASLAHHGVLFLDEFPEFTPQVLDALRQPLETAECIIARANHRVSYPAAIQLVAAMNPCRCGMAGEPGRTRRRPALHDRLPGAHLRSADGPHRYPHRRSGRQCRRSVEAGGGGKQRGGGAPGRPRPCPADRPLRRPRSSGVDEQRPVFDIDDREDRRARRGRPATPPGRCRENEILRPRLPPRAEGRTHARRSRWRADRRPHPSGRSDFLPHCRREAEGGGVEVRSKEKGRPRAPFPIAGKPLA